jgi:hypothetical protein
MFGNKPKMLWSSYNVRCTSDKQAFKLTCDAKDLHAYKMHLTSTNLGTKAKFIMSLAF